VAWRDVTGGAIDEAAFFEAARMLDWREHCEALASKASSNGSG